MNIARSVITLTFGDCAENHVGMEKLGQLSAKGEGYSVAELNTLQTKLKNEHHLNCELYRLDQNEYEEFPEAAVLVIRNGVDALIATQAINLFNEQAALDVDKKAKMYGRVVQKHARWNLCFDDIGHDPDYENGKGRVVAYKDVPFTQRLKANLPAFFGEKARELKCEANYYYDVKKCGIGFHGDSERRKVIGIRLGASLDMVWQWYKDNEVVDEPIVVPLNGGDVYIMSEKAVGTDWKQRSIYTLRHATGCEKFVTV